MSLKAFIFMNWTLVLFVLLASDSHAIYRGKQVYTREANCWNFFPKVDHLDNEYVHSFVHFANSDHALLCGGVMINHRHVLTAAHCPIRTEDNAFVGSRSLFDGQRSIVDKIVRHPLFNLNSSTFDLAKIRLHRLLVRNVPLPINWDAYLLPQGSETRILGFGLYRAYRSPGKPSQVLRYGTSRITDVTVCGKRFGLNFVSPAHELCFHQRHSIACPGDSGGPVLNRSHMTGEWELIRIIMGGEYGVHDEKYCNPKGIFSAMNLEGSKEWIIQTTSSDA